MAGNAPHIDRESRRHAARLLRWFVAGRITNDEFESKVCALPTRDPAISRLFIAAWHYYDDFYEHRLTGVHGLTAGQRLDFARWILFLHTGNELPTMPKQQSIEFLDIVTFGASFARRRRRQMSELSRKSQPSLRYFPFSSKQGFEDAKRMNLFLCGR